MCLVVNLTRKFNLIQYKMKFVVESIQILIGSTTKHIVDSDI